MPQSNLAPILNKLLAVIGRSFPQYVRYARPYVPPGREMVLETICAICRDQDGLAERIGLMLAEKEFAVRPGGFSMEYTDTHDLGIDYLLSAAVKYQRQDIRVISQLVEQLQLFPAGKALAEEALGMAKGHLETLQELLPQASPAG